MFSLLPAVAIYQCTFELVGVWIGKSLFLNVKLRFYLLDQIMQNEVIP